MLYYLFAVGYVLACFLLLLVVLLQQGKGGDMASAFGGGGSQTAFGARAGATVLTKATAVLGVLFMLGAIGLGIMGQRGPGLADARSQRTGRGAGPRARRIAGTHPRGPDDDRFSTRAGAAEEVGTRTASGRTVSPLAKVAELADAPA